ncbi:hypothetical protein BKA59DRAFT_470875 [Fusarium tricinctum]|uniref:Uncharacterized protein n=1 Tax=Fusarium tricinctum TaxID=61284 RepID=A0A8K0S9B0_9HYPO|nr:hypothetical protein BKA59DRAFT_470875 [Fusarium tricinctum]
MKIWTGRTLMFFVHYRVRGPHLIIHALPLSLHDSVRADSFTVVLNDEQSHKVNKIMLLVLCSSTHKTPPIPICS